MTGTVIGALLLVCVFLAGLTLFLVRRSRRARNLSMDEMEGHDFEYYCADLLRQAGFEDVQVTRGSGDFGADILACKDGVTYAVQCKCYEDAVGVHAVQEVFAGKAYYDRMVGAVMTNRTFTDPAVRCAEKLGILLWDRDVLEEMAGE